jgi:hypothetical protein
MPFPLAHPAAVLPLRRYCPKYLSFPALVVGSLCPDAGYCLRHNVGEFSHRLLGSFGFCLPVGIVLLLLLYGIILPAIGRLPDRFQRMVPTTTLKPLGPPLVVLLSLLVGAWTHLLWDSFTHTRGWLVEQLPVLHAPLVHVAGRTVRVCNVLWYSCSFGGVILVFLAYDRWLQTSHHGTPPAHIKTHWPSAVLLAVLVLPIELVHHLVHDGDYLMVPLTLALVLSIALKIKPTTIRT